MMKVLSQFLLRLSLWAVAVFLITLVMAHAVGQDVHVFGVLLPWTEVK